METRSVQARVLSRSGQPRRRLARRRQHLPNPVLRERKDSGFVDRADFHDTRNALIVSPRISVRDPMVVELMTDLGSDAVGSI